MMHGLYSNNDSDALKVSDQPLFIDGIVLIRSFVCQKRLVGHF